MTFASFLALFTADRRAGGLAGVAAALELRWAGWLWRWRSPRSSGRPCSMPDCPRVLDRRLRADRLGRERQAQRRCGGAGDADRSQPDRAGGPPVRDAGAAQTDAGRPRCARSKRARAASATSTRSSWATSRWRWRCSARGRARRRLSRWIWTALVFGVLALGPLLQIGGRYRFSLDNLLPEGVTFPLPFTLLHFIPFINANRAPNRNSVILMLALAVLAGYGAAWLLGRISKWRISESANGREQASRGRQVNASRSTLYAHRIPCLPVYLSTRRPHPRRTPRRPAADDRRRDPRGLPADRGGAGRVRDHAVAARLAQQLRRAGQRADQSPVLPDRPRQADASAATSAARRPTRWTTLPASRSSRR